MLQAAGVRIPGPDGDGGRIPGLSAWRKQPPRRVWLSASDVLLVVEIVSPGSETMDSVTKLREYAAVGIPHYWVVDRDNVQTVTLHRLTGPGGYQEQVKLPLAWLLQSAPGDHLD